jgi:hypothetical protein
MEEKSVKSPEMPPRFQSAWELPGEISAMKNCARFNEGLTTLSEEVLARFISLLSPFDRTQGPVCGEKVGQVT